MLDDEIREAAARRSLPVPAIRRHLREVAGIPQAAIAKELGVSAASISRYETGARSPRGQLAIAYQSVLDRLAREVFSA